MIAMVSNFLRWPMIVLRSTLVVTAALSLPTCDRGGHDDDADDGEMLEDDDGDAGTGAIAATPVEFTEKDLARVTAVLNALRPLMLAKHIERFPNANERPPLRIGADLAHALGKDALPAVRKEGFASADEFDALLANVLVTWQRVNFGDTGGFDSGDRVYRLKLSRQEQQDELDKLPSDTTLTPADRKQRERELRNAMDEIDQQLAELSDRTLAMKQRFDNLPQSNIDVVAKHRAELARLFAPR